MEFFYGIYKQGNEVLLAICDENIIDKVFQNNEKMIKIDVKKSFLSFRAPPIPARRKDVPE